METFSLKTSAALHLSPSAPKSSHIVTTYSSFYLATLLKYFANYSVAYNLILLILRHANKTPLFLFKRTMYKTILYMTFVRLHIDQNILRQPNI